METLKHSNLSENLYFLKIFVLFLEIRVFKSSIFMPNFACFVSVSFGHASNLIPDVSAVSASRDLALNL